MSVETLIQDTVGDIKQGDISPRIVLPWIKVSLDNCPLSNYILDKCDSNPKCQENIK